MNFLECKCCKVLSEQLDLANREKMRLLELLLDKTIPAPSVAVVEKEQEFTPIRGFKPWAAKRAELESIDRQKAAEAINKAAKSDDDIERLEDLVLSGTK